MVPAFEREALALGAGERSEVFETRFGFHVVEVLQIQEPSVPPFESSQERLRRLLREEEIGRLRGEARARYPVTYAEGLDARLDEG